MRVVPGLFVVASTIFEQKRQLPAFPGSARVTLAPAAARPATVEVFCRDQRPVRSGYDAAAGRAIYLWGRAAHATLSSTDALLRWCADAAAEGDDLRQLYGNFVLIVDDRRRREVTFASDVLGVRPWFVRQVDERAENGLVAGSDVLALHDAGYSDGATDADAVSSWLHFNYDLTGGSVLKQYRRPPAGAAVVYDERGRRRRERAYAAFTADDRQLSPAETLAGIHERVRHVFGVMTRDVRAVTLPLSGGYDSRYLFALGNERESLWTTAVNVRSSTAESTLARQVGDALGEPVKVLPSDGHTLDLFDDPFAISPGGFPAGRNLASAVARRHPGTPVVSGFLGDLLVRGSGDRCGGQLPTSMAQADLAGALARHHAFKLNRLDLLRPAFARGVRERAHAAIARLAASAPAGKAFAFGNLLGRQRFYIANIFLQHLDSAEAILPFYSWDLIDFKMRLSPDCFSFENYPRLFETYFPKIAGIPHSSTLKKASPPPPTPKTRHLRPWTRTLLGELLRPAGDSSLIDRRKLLRRLPGGLGHNPARHDEVLFLYKVHLFESTLRRHGLATDWDGR